MVKKISHQGITWIDVTSPTKDEVQDLAKEHDLHPLLQNELLSPSLRSKVDVYEEYLFLVLHIFSIPLVPALTPRTTNIADQIPSGIIIGCNP